MRGAGTGNLALLFGTGDTPDTACPANDFIEVGSIAVPDALPGDACFASSPSSLAVGLVAGNARIVNPGLVTPGFGNLTAAVINSGVRPWTVIVMKQTAGF